MVVTVKNTGTRKRLLSTATIHFKEKGKTRKISIKMQELNPSFGILIIHPQQTVIFENLDIPKNIPENSKIKSLEFE